MKKKTPEIDLERYQADVDACMLFLITNQKDWQPHFYMSHTHGEQPMTIIAKDALS